MNSVDILTIHGGAEYLELKNICQLVASCKHYKLLYTPYLHSTRCIYMWIQAAESWDFLDDKTLVALWQTSVTVKDILHIPVHSRKSDFELSHVLLERIPSDSFSDSEESTGSSEFYGRDLFTLVNRFNQPLTIHD